MMAITGATGMTGRFVLAALRGQGHEGPLRCLVRSAGALADPGGKVEPIRGDCMDPDSLVALLKGCDRLIHVAGIRFAPFVLEACRRTRVRRVVFVNTTGIYSKYRSVAADYRALERSILESDLDFTIIRPTMIYGTHLDHNIHKLILLIDRHRIVPVVGKGDALLQPIYVEDLAQAIAAAAMSDRSIGKDYDVAGEEPIAHAQALRVIAESLGKRPVFVHVPYPIALAAGQIGELLPGELLKVEKIKRLLEDRAFSYEPATRDLGFSPRSFRQGVQLEVAEMRAVRLI